MSDKSLPPEGEIEAPVIGASNGFSFVKNTASKEYAILNELMPRMFTDVQNDLRNIDRAVTRAERLIAHGEEMIVKGNKFNVSPTDLAALCGKEAWEEIVGIATKGRVFLKSVGYEAVTKGRPAVFMEPQGNVSTAGLPPTGTAIAMVEERVVVGRGGDMDIKRMMVSPVTKPKRTPLTPPPAGT